VYLFLQGGRIAVKITETQKKGFDIQSVLFQIETTLVGTKDNVSMRFSLSEGWSDNLEIVKPF
jgi:hypothetical protein